MIQALGKYSKAISWFLASLFYVQLFVLPLMARSEALPYTGTGGTGIPGFKKISKREVAPGAVESAGVIKNADAIKTTGEINAPRSGAGRFGTGPSQPEMQAFSSVNSTNMVDLFSGDFSYNIPLMDVGGYPINIAYRSGISMDQEASWVGLGWNINPGTISRNMRGLPDDFNGLDSIKKITSIRENKTIGVNVEGDVELTGLPIKLGGGVGVFHNNYKGWGIENSLNASINAAIGAKGYMTAGLALNNNSQEGLSVSPSLNVGLKSLQTAENNSGYDVNVSASLPYNSRSGLRGLQLSTGITQQKWTKANQTKSGSGSLSSFISFAVPSYTPTIQNSFISRQFSFTGKLGSAQKAVHPNVYIKGYVSKQRIDGDDTLMAVPAYGYLHFTEGARNHSALLDFNREKELVYREKPATPHIALPVYTYDAFSISGEGTGGMFRAYRGDIGFVYDHFIRSKDESDKFSADLGFGDLFHAGIDLNMNRAFTQNGPWLQENTLKNTIAFKDSGALYEPVYFRNPGEKSINSKQFYDALGGDDVVAVDLYQAGIGPFIQATNYLTRYSNKRAVGKTLLTPQNTIRPERDKRTQVISYLTAKQASIAGLSKFIESYDTASYTFDNCTDIEGPEAAGTGLPAEYFNNTSLKGLPVVTSAGEVINLNLKRNSPRAGVNADNFSIRWKGRLLAPVTGRYNIIADSTDDGVRVWLNDSLMINKWCENCAPFADTAKVNLISGEFYNIKVEYMDRQRDASLQLKWTHPQQPVKIAIPMGFLYGAPADPVHKGMVTREKRFNSFRKEHHISEIDVLNSDGRRYVYGIPVYNLRQHEATFAVDGKNRGNKATGLVGYSNQDNSTNNRQGKDWYYNSEDVPAYAHSFLLTGILSADYTDATGNGISDDDLGDAIKFNYSKIRGLNNPYRWRAPFNDSLTYNDGLKTDSRDDKGNYAYGERELWYLHSVESKTMVAVFVLEGRLDIPAITEAGTKVYDGSARRLKEIRLYTKSDLKKNSITRARPIKTVHFEYSYELCKGVNNPLSDSGKLTLKKIWFTYNGNKKGAQNPYVFNYNSKNPEYNIKSYDRWGNYKDPLENPGSSGGNLISNAEYPYSIQDSVKAAKNAAAWALDSIKLPSGGAIKVTYESDDYAFVQNKRAMQLFKILGLGTTTSFAAASNRLYTIGGDNLYVFISVPSAVSDTADMYRKYLAGIKKLYFRLSVQMPADKWGSGYEYVSCYADLAPGKSYGIASANVIWVKLSGITLKGDAAGNFSPLSKAALQFLRLNLPSKAYPGSEVGDDMDVQDAVKMLASLLNNVVNAYGSFDVTGRLYGWGKNIDTARSYVRLNSPLYKKYGGGHRVKQVVVYDKWDKMASGKLAKYGQQYIYTTTRDINGTATTISSGVASYEPGIGGDENPFHEPIEYVEKISVLGPVTLAYSEEPLGESFFPSANVGYSKVRVRTINYQNIKSANGYDETNFYTAYDFPTYTDRSLIDDNTRKRYKPELINFLRIDAKHYLTLSQGFKVELNDMHGKVRSQASYAESDPNNPVTYTENIYRVENPRIENKRLANTVPVIRPNGAIDTAALVGKDVELMVDMREQLSVANGYNINLNNDMFTIPAVPPLFLLPSFLNLAQREETRYRSVATVKVIQRYGILDSVIHIDKGSKVSTKDILYDSETGNAVLTRTQNEFNDFVYNFTYPSHWAYDGMGLAYRNTGARFDKVTIRNGKITTGLPAADSVLFASGDEIIVGGKIPTEAGCNPNFSTFPSYSKIWAIDSSILSGGPKAFFFLDKEGRPYNAFDVSLRIIRSGRKNIDAPVGTVTTLANPMMKNGSNQYELRFSDTSKIIAAAATEMKQFWHVADQKRRKFTMNCPITFPDDCGMPYILPSATDTIISTTDTTVTMVRDSTGVTLTESERTTTTTVENATWPPSNTSCNCLCLKKLFNYLIASRRLFISKENNITVDSIVRAANNAGYSVSVTDCPLLQSNRYKPFYALTTDSVGTRYRAALGSCSLNWSATSSVNFYDLVYDSCQGSSVLYKIPGGGGYDTTKRIYGPTKALTFYDVWTDSSSSGYTYGIHKDTATPKIIAGSRAAAGDQFYISTHVKFDSIKPGIIPAGATLASAKMWLNHSTLGFNSPSLPNAHTLSSLFINPFRIMYPQFDWDYSTSLAEMTSWSTPLLIPHVSSVNQDFVLDVKGFVQNWITSSTNRGMAFFWNTTSSNLRHATFASHLDANPEVMPLIEVTFTTPRENITALLNVEFCHACDTIIDTTCRSIVTDTAFNPYTTGVLGNWRSYRSYTYYGQRAESDPTSATNIRTNGTFKDFAAFWKFENNQLKPHPDTARWVWNSQVTMFNLKGFEIENKDPLGRYNAGLYGYKLAMPVAVVQNARYRESAFEGFEDYDFSTQVCDTGCATDRHFDFSAFKNKLDTAYRHTGKRSLKLNGGEQAAMTVKLSSATEQDPSLVFATETNSCGSGLLRDIKSPKTILLPAFSPVKSKKMVLSAWVKEGQACSCTDYTNNRIVIAFSGGSSVLLQSAGNIIEGWQRYESVFDIPASDTTITISLEATGATAVYFDDIRVHPFNANMKSFVYSPVNLRLMAELDENNYATFYEYDDDGTLIRVKKETERGVKTIKETRSALLKEQSY